MSAPWMSKASAKRKGIILAEGSRLGKIKKANQGTYG